MQNGVDGIESLCNIPESRYPLFATVSEMLRLLDKSLAGEPFLGEAEKTKKALNDEEGGLGAMGDYFAQDYDSSDEEGKLDARITVMIRVGLRKRRLKFNEHFTKPQVT